MEILRWSKIAGKAAFHAARSVKTRTRPLPYHGHDFAEIFWVDAGQGIHRVNSATQPLQTGSLILMRPRDCHGIDPLGQGELKLTNIAFPVETLDFLGQRYFSRRGGGFWHPEPSPPLRQIEPAQLRRFNRWADELSQAPRERLAIERFLLNVLAEISLETNQAMPEDAPDWMAHACRLMQKRDHFAGGVREFLRLCGRSREHVARMVRLHLGTTPTAYVNSLRMAYAKRQLEMGDQSILEVALDCGIGNLSHFYDLFRAQTGLTPRAYRLSHHRSI